MQVDCFTSVIGKKLSIDTTEILSLYDLGHKWKQETDGTFVKGELVDKQPPQLLFIERCFQMLKDGGRMGIVLLESIFGMPKYQYVVNYIQSNKVYLRKFINNMPKKKMYKKETFFWYEMEHTL